MISDTELDEVLVSLQVVQLVLDAIAEKRRIVGDVIEPVRTINDAARLARAASARLDRAVTALTPRAQSPTQPTDPTASGA